MTTKPPSLHMTSGFNQPMCGSKLLNMTSQWDDVTCKICAKWNPQLKLDAVYNPNSERHELRLRDLWRPYQCKTYDKGRIRMLMSGQPMGSAEVIVRDYFTSLEDQDGQQEEARKEEEADGSGPDQSGTSQKEAGA